MRAGLITGAILDAPVLITNTTLPQNPKPGQFLFYRNRVWYCMSISDGTDGSALPTWIPLTNEIQLLQYLQSTPASDWVVDHQMGTDVIVQVFDDNGQVVIPNNIDVSTADRIIVSMPYAMTGIVRVLGGSAFGSLPSLSNTVTDEFTNVTEQTFVHGLGYNPLVQVVIDGAVFVPESVTFPTTNSVTITFSSPQTGEVRFV